MRPVSGRYLVRSPGRAEIAGQPEGAGLAAPDDQAV
jgi:hypothetical protein